MKRTCSTLALVAYHVAEVRTRIGPFPEDMLRYDAAALHDHQLQEDGPDGRELRQVSGSPDRHVLLISSLGRA